jgi:hypothetical protein
MDALPDEPFAQIRDVGLVLDGGIGKGAAAPRFGGVLAGAAVDVVDALCLGIVGLEVGVAEGPRG